MAESNTEQIKYETELLKLIALFTLAIGGGSIGLFLGTLTPLKLLLAWAGTFVTVILIAGAWRQNKRIRKLFTGVQET